MQLKYFLSTDTKETCHKRYKELCKIYHPDNNSGNTVIMAEINNEYSYIKSGKKQEADVETTIEHNVSAQDLSKLIKETTLEDVFTIANFIFSKDNEKKKKKIIDLMKKCKLI